MVPTTLPRTQITHTPQVRHALRIAAQEWPEAANRPGVLLTRLATKAADELEKNQDAVWEARLARREAVAGKFAGMYPEGYLEELRAGRPE